MGNFFDLFLKGFVTIIVLYVSFNATFRYHSVIRISLLFAVVTITFGSYFFIGTTFFIGYGIFIGTIALTSISLRLFLAYKKRDLFLLISVIDKDPRPDRQAITDMFVDAGGENQNLVYVGEGQSVIMVKNTAKTEVKKFQKLLEDYFQKKTKRFGLVQYFHIVAALIIIASIWRF